jgi:choline dehydrogenase-like flavoprotein
LTGKVSEGDAEAGFGIGEAGLYIPSFCEMESKNFAGGYGIQVSIGRGIPTWSMVAFGEMEPRYENHVSLDATAKDAWGIPVAKIECAHSQADVNMVEHMKRTLPEIAAAGGLQVEEILDLSPSRKKAFRRKMAFRLLGSLFYTDYGAFWPGLAIHETGGARMGDRPDNSVVNSFCQVWDADNVFVTDGACFVSPGFQNHTLTMMALTVRACQFIVRDYANGGC